MEFLNAWAIGIGVLAIGAPLAVHLLTKPRPTAMPLSTIRFVNEVIRQRRARNRLRDWLLLLLRMLCVALLAMALARPLWNERPAVPTTPETGSHRIILMDQSLSMMAGRGGVTAWSTAVASALPFLNQSGDMRAAVILVGAKPRPVFDQWSPNLGALREAVTQAKPIAEQAEPRAALELAARLFDQAPAGTKELVIVSDFQRANWGTLLIDLIPQDVRIQFQSVAQDSLANVAVTDVRWDGQPVAGQALSLHIDVANYSDQSVNIRCALDMSTVQRSQTATLQPQSTATLSESVSIDALGWHHGWVRLENNLDVLPDDDARPFAWHVRAPLKVALLTRQPKNQIPSSSFYLEQSLGVALAPNAWGAKDTVGDDEWKVVERLNPSRDSVGQWPASDVFVLDHPGQLSDEALQHLANRLRRGKGLLYVTDELVDAMNLRRLAEILGSEFQPPIELLPDDVSRARKDLFVRQANSRQRPFDVLASSNVAALLRPIRFAGGLPTKTIAEGLRSLVLAELSDTSSLLYITRVGAGSMAVLNTDLGRSNWPVQPTFLPVVGELIQGLVGQGAQRQANCGEPLVRSFSESVDRDATLVGRTIAGPPPQDGSFGTWEWNAMQGALVWNWQEPAGAGIYALDLDSVPEMMVATSTPAVESDLSTLPKEILTSRLSGTRKVGYATVESAESTTDQLWNWLILACLGGLVMEIAALRWSRM